MAAFFNKGDKQNPWIAKAESALEKGLMEDAAELFVKAADAEPNNASLWMKLASTNRYCGKYEAAARAYTKAVEIKPDEGQAWIQLALYYGEKGKFEEALSAISHVVIPDSEPYILEQKCEWLERTGKYLEAAAISSRLISPTSKTYRVKTADLLLRGGRFAEAREMYDELSRSMDEDASGYAADSGLCCEMMGDTQAALFRYQNADEGDTLAQYRKARLEEAAGNFKEAAASYAKVQQAAFSEDISVSIRRAMALFWSGSTKEAAAQLEKVISRANSSPDLWYLLGTVSFMNGSLNRAIEAFDTVLKIGSATPSLWYMKGAAEFLLGKYMDSLESFEKTGKTGSSVKGSMFNEDEMELFTTPEKSPVKVEFTSVNEGLLSMQAVALAALGRYAEADKAARGVLDSDSSRTDMEILRLRCLAGLGKYTQSADAFARVSAKLPEDYTILLEHGEMQMLSGEYREAVKTWEKLLSVCPGNPLIAARLLQSASAAGELEEANAVAESLISEMPHDMTALLSMADAAYAAGAYEEAESRYREAASLQPANPVALAGLGNSLLMLGRFAEAKVSFAEAAANSSDAVGFRLKEAKAMAEAGEADEAIALYMDIVSEKPEISGVAGEVARLAYSVRRFADAADAASYAVSENTADFPLLMLGGDACMASDRVEEAVTYYSQACELSPENVSAALSLAKACMANGEYAEALVRLKIVTESGDVNALYDKAVCEVNTGDLKAAEATLQQLLGVDEENQAALLLLADIYEKTGEFDAVLEIFGQYLALNSENVDVFRKAAAIYRMRGELEEAVSGYEMILERCQNDVVTLRFKAEALFSLGEYREAADICAAVLEHGEDEAVHLLYAEALANAGNSEAAQNEFADILKGGSKSLAAFLSYADLLSRNGDYVRAETAYSRIISQFPKHERAYLERCMNAVKTGNMDAVSSALQEAATACPKNPYVLAGVGYLYAVSGCPNDALSFLNKAESAGCKDIDLYCCRAQIYLSQCRFDLAEKEASEVLRRRPANKTALHLKAKALEGLGAIREAVELYNRLLEVEEFEEEDIELPEREEKKPAKKPEPKKSYADEYDDYGDRREKSGYRDMIIN